MDHVAPSKPVMFLLDTNHASRYMDGHDEALNARLEAVDPTLLNVCSVVGGELWFMVHASQRRDENAENLSALLDLLGMYEVTDGVAERYGRLKADLIARFGPRDRRARAATTLRDIGVSDNDLWVASVALHYNLTLLSRDGDFDRIAEVVELKRESWLAI